jgi:hypothetical protein
MYRSPADRKAEAARLQQLTEEATKPLQQRTQQPAGYNSNARITARNGGVRHQFLGDIGGCSDNYR